MAKKALGDTNLAPPRPERKKKRAKAESGALDTAGGGPKKRTPEKLNKRRVLFIADVFFNPVKKRADAEDKSPSEIIREAIVAYLNL